MKRGEPARVFGQLGDVGDFFLALHGRLLICKRPKHQLIAPRKIDGEGEIGRANTSRPTDRLQIADQHLKTFERNCAKKLIEICKMPVRRGLGNASAPRSLAQGQGVTSTNVDQGHRRIKQRLSKIAMMITRLLAS